MNTIARRRLLLWAALAAGGRAAAAPSRRDLEASAAPHSAGTPGSEAYRYLKDIARVYAGRRLRVVSEDTPPSRATRELMRHEFTPLSGIEVSWELLPLDRVLPKIAVDAARRAGLHDVFYIDQSWIGRFVDDTVALPELLARTALAYPGYDVDDILPTLFDHVASYRGRRAGVPYDIPLFILIYRRDVLAQLGLAVPRTVPQFVDAVAAVTRALAPRVYGYTAQWKPGHYGLECNMSAWLWAHGGSIYGADGRSRLGDEPAAQALRTMLELSRHVPPGATTWDWSGEAASFARGEAAFFLSWGEYLPSFDDPATSRIAGLAEPAPCPRELALCAPQDCGHGEHPGFAHQGGSYLGVSRYSRNIEPAWVFLQWATSADVTTRASMLGGGASPIRASNYADPRVLARAAPGPGTTRHFAVTLDAIRHRMGTEPHLLPRWSALATDSLSVEVGRMLTRQQDVRTTQANMLRAANAYTEPR